MSGFLKGKAWPGYTCCHTLVCVSFLFIPCCLHNAVELVNRHKMHSVILPSSMFLLLTGGTTSPSHPHSWTNSPKSDRTPQEIHTIRDIPTLPECFRMPLGEMKIPAPMMVPMIMAIPRSRVTFFPSPTLGSSCSCSFPLGSAWVPFWENVCPFPSVYVFVDLLVIF